MSEKQQSMAGTTRRRLLGAGGLAAAGAVLGVTSTSAESGPRAGGTCDPAQPKPLLPPDRIGVQLFSLNSALSSSSFDAVFGRVAEIGFKQVEFAGYSHGAGAITPKQIGALLDKHGLEAIGSHVSPSNDASMTRILDDAEAIGIPQVGLSMLVPDVPGGWKSVAAKYNRWGEIAAQRGIGFYLHNHFQEWAPAADDPTKRGHDVLLENTDPRFVFFQLDIYWATIGSLQAGGAFDPLTDYAIPNKDRYKLFHVKDGTPMVNRAVPHREICDVGQGIIDFQDFFTKLFATAEGQDKKHHYIWERDNANSHPRGAWAAAMSSFVNMRYGLRAPQG